MCFAKLLRVYFESKKGRGEETCVCLDERMRLDWKGKERRRRTTTEAVHCTTAAAAAADVCSVERLLHARHRTARSRVQTTLFRSFVRSLVLLVILKWQQHSSTWRENAHRVSCVVETVIWSHQSSTRTRCIVFRMQMRLPLGRLLGPPAIAKRGRCWSLVIGWSADARYCDTHNKFKTTTFP